MAIGFRQRDPSGNILVDITTRLPRIIGRVTVTAGVNGSVAVPASGTNPLFYRFLSNAASTQFNASPKIEVNDTTGVLSWSFISPNPSFQTGGTLEYGRY